MNHSKAIRQQNRTDGVFHTGKTAQILRNQAAISALQVYLHEKCLVWFITKAHPEQP